MTMAGTSKDRNQELRKLKKGKERKSNRGGVCRSAVSTKQRHLHENLTRLEGLRLWLILPGITFQQYVHGTFCESLLLRGSSHGSLSHSLSISPTSEPPPVLNPTLSLLPHLSPSLPTYLSPLSPYNEIVAQTSKLILKTWHKFFETLCGRDSVLWDFGGPANVQNLFKTCLKCLFCL